MPSEESVIIYFNIQKFVLLTFYLYGISGLIAWNSIISILDFFIHFVLYNIT